MHIRRTKNLTELEAICKEIWAKKKFPQELKSCYKKCSQAVMSRNVSLCPLCILLPCVCVCVCPVWYSLGHSIFLVLKSFLWFLPCHLLTWFLLRLRTPVSPHQPRHLINPIAKPTHLPFHAMNAQPTAVAIPNTRQPVCPWLPPTSHPSSLNNHFAN